MENKKPVNPRDLEKERETDEQERKETKLLRTAENDRNTVDSTEKLGEGIEPTRNDEPKLESPGA